MHGSFSIIGGAHARAAPKVYAYEYDKQLIHPKGSSKPHPYISTGVSLKQKTGFSQHHPP